MPIRLTTPESSAIAVDCEAILDTGSDCTLIPLPLLMQVNARAGDYSVRIPFSGVVTLAVPYDVGLVFDRYALSKIQVFGCSVYDLGELPIIGRDLLNRYRIEFEGPNETFKIF